MYVASLIKLHITHMAILFTFNKLTLALSVTKTTLNDLFFWIMLNDLMLLAPSMILNQVWSHLYIIAAQSLHQHNRFLPFHGDYFRRFVPVEQSDKFCVWLPADVSAVPQHLMWESNNKDVRKLVLFFLERKPSPIRYLMIQPATKGKTF